MISKNKKDSLTGNQNITRIKSEKLKFKIKYQKSDKICTKIIGKSLENWYIIVLDRKGR